MGQGNTTAPNSNAARSVFVSHAFADAVAAGRVVEQLEQRGIQCWMAPRDVPFGEGYPGRIVAAIKDSRVVLLMYSGHAAESRHVESEIRIAVEEHKLVIPVRLDRTELSSDMRYWIGAANWIDAIAPPIDQHIERIVGAVTAQVRAPNAVAPPKPPAADTQATIRRDPPSRDAPKKLDLTGVRRRQIHMFFVLDCSGSMEGENIRSLNYALRSAIPEMRKAAESNPEIEVLVRAVRFADHATWHIARPTPVHELEWDDVTAKGHTKMGAALTLVAEQLAPSALPGPQLRPIIILVSDGHPTDDFASGLRALDASPYGAKAVRIAIAIGSDADQGALKKFMGKSEHPLLYADNAGEIVDQLRWASSVTVGEVSQPGRKASQQVRPAEPQKATSIVWDQRGGARRADRRSMRRGPCGWRRVQLWPVC